MFSNREDTLYLSIVWEETISLDSLKKPVLHDSAKIARKILSVAKMKKSL